MSKANHTLSVELLAKTSKFQTAMANATKSLDRMSKKMKNLGRSMSISVTAPLMAIGGIGLKSAMELEATEAKFSTVFGNMADEVDDYLKEFKKLTPATQAEARSMASGIQDLLVPMGFMREDATHLTTKTMHLVGALTNFNNATHSAEDVSQAFQSALTGMYRPLKSLGIQTSKTEVQQKAVEMGLASTTSEVTKQMEALALMEIAYEQSGDALNAYTWENMDTKTALGLLWKSIQDLAGEILTVFLPAIKDLTLKALEWTQTLQGMDEATKRQIVIIGALVAGIAPALLAISKMMTLTSGLMKVFSTFGTVILAHPLLALGAVLVAVAYKMGLFDGVIAKIQETFANFDMSTFIDTLTTSLQPALDVLIGAFNYLAPIIETVLVTAVNACIPIIESLKEAFTTLAPALTLIGEQILDRLKGSFELFANVLNIVIPIVSEFITEIIDVLTPVLNALVLAMEPVVDSFFNVADMILQTVVPALKPLKETVVSLASVIARMLTPIINGLKYALAWLLPYVEKLIKWLLDLTVRVLRGLNSGLNSTIRFVSNFGQAFKTAWQIAKTAWSGAVDFFKGIFEDIGDMVGGVFGGVSDVVIDIKTGVSEAFKKAIDSLKKIINENIIDKINTKINKLIKPINDTFDDIQGVKIETWFGDITPFSGFTARVPYSNIPHLAEGGIVSSPTTALIGEGNEPEIVAPLSHMRQMINGGGSGKTATIIVNLDGRTIAKAVGQELVDELQINTRLSY